jgi:hypothetical protein
MHSEQRPNPDRSPEALEARLHALPQPPVPAGLETRLLAAIPAKLPSPRRSWAVRVGVAGVLAACLLAFLAWLGRDGKGPVPRSPSTEPEITSLPATPRPPDDNAGVAVWLETRRVLEGGEPPAFAWPLEETPPLTVSTAIAPDLFD